MSTPESSHGDSESPEVPSSEVRATSLSPAPAEEKAHESSHPLEAALNKALDEGTLKIEGGKITVNKSVVYKLEGDLKKAINPGGGVGWGGK